MDPVDAFLARLLPPDPAPAARAEAAVAPNQGALLHLLARAVGARRVLEVGTLHGYSAAWLATALPADGELVTLEVDPGAAAAAAAAVPAARVVVGPALETLRDLDGPFDLVFLDGDKAQAAETLAAVLPLCRPGTLVVADNVVRGGAVADPDDPDPRVRGVRALVDAVAAEPRLVATALQTVGEKGHDGLLLALVV
jgi:predicted O-methyltransferase YrrM